jgi:hypothetical protein
MRLNRKQRTYPMRTDTQHRTDLTPSDKRKLKVAHMAGRLRLALEPYLISRSADEAGILADACIKVAADLNQRESTRCSASASCRMPGKCHCKSIGGPNRSGGQDAADGCHRAMMAKESRGNRNRCHEHREAGRGPCEKGGIHADREPFGNLSG